MTLPASLPLDTAALDPDLRAERALRISNIDGCTYALMVGVSESYFAAMAVELGHRDTALALVLTLPMLIGSAAQLLAGPLTALLGARKRLVVAGATLQAFSTLGLYFIAQNGVRALVPLLVVQSFYYACCLIVGPPWGAWMATLTAGRKRERYFARRGAMVQGALLVAFVSAGMVLQRAGADSGAKLHTFAMLHLCAFGFRCVSACLLALQPDLERGARRLSESLTAIGTAARTADFRVPAYLAMLMFGAHLAVPFFTPYMLHDLELDYAAYAGLIAIPIVVKALFFPWLHPLSERIGMRALLTYSGALVMVLPALWVVFDSVPGLAFVQLLSGFGWGGVEFASYQLLLVSARSECTVEFLSLASTMTSSAQVAGGLSAGSLRSSFGLPYHALFLLSSTVRAFALACIAGRLPQRLRRHVPRVFLRTISVRPGPGSVQGPILADTRSAAEDCK
jgi:MFS family permease